MGAVTHQRPLRIVLRSAPVGGRDQAGSSAEQWRPLNVRDLSRCTATMPSRPASARSCSRGAIQSWQASRHMMATQDFQYVQVLTLLCEQWMASDKEEAKDLDALGVPRDARMLFPEPPEHPPSSMQDAVRSCLGLLVLLCPLLPHPRALSAHAPHLELS